MSRTIDERVVSMQFDNKQFENNAQTSISTLNKLKQSLDLTGAAKGLEGIDTAVKKVNISPLSSAVETVSAKFSALQVMAVTALANITNSAVNAGKRIASSLTIEPIKTGFAEYETQIGSVQTILANTQSKGSTLEDVNAALDELNTYADKTIYNFTEMTRNIGTFTAAGVDLDKSVTSIKGIANLAAISGSTSQQASTAMYQLSQALAAGKVQLMDWNSVVNAGMGGEVFQTALKRTAKQMGTDVDALIKKYGSFRESLTQGEWLTAEVLTETLTQLSGAYTEADLLAKGYSKDQAAEILKLADTAQGAATDVKTFTQLVDTLKESAQSGWTQTWEIIVGDFEEAKELWSGVSKVFGDMIGKSADKRNTLLSGAFDNNWDKLIGKINEAGMETSVFEEKLKDVAKSHGIDVDTLISTHGSLEKAFRSGAISSDILKEAVGNLSTSLVDLSGIEKDLKKGNSGEDVKKIQEALKGLGYDLGKWDVDGVLGSKTEEAIKKFQELNGLEVTGIVDEKTIEALEKASGKAVELKGSVGELIDGITELGGRELVIESLKNVFEGLKTVIHPIKKAFETVFPPMTSEQLYKILEGFRDLTAQLKLSPEQIHKVFVTFKGLFSVLDIGWTFIKELVKGIAGLLKNLTGLGDGILDAASSIGLWLIGLRDSAKETDIFGTAVGRITGFLQGAIDGIRAFVKYVQDNFHISEYIQKAVDGIRNLIRALRIRFTMPGFEGFFDIFSKIWDAIENITRSIGKAFSGIGKAIGNAFRNGDIDAGLDILNSGLLTGVLLGIKKFLNGVTENFESGFGFLDSIKDVLGSVKDSLTSWQQDLKSDILLKIAGAIGILALSILVLASIDPGKLTFALGAITMLFVDLVKSMQVLTSGALNTKGIIAVSGAMVGMALAVLLLAAALKSLSSLSWEELGKGILGVMGLTAIVVLAAKALSSNTATVIKGAGSMVLFAFAIKILASVCKDLASMSWEELGKGLLSLGLILAAISLFINKTKFESNTEHILSAAVSMVIFATAIKILVSACKDLGQMSAEELVKGLGSVGAILVGISLFTKHIGKADNMMSVGVGMIGVAAAIKILASAVKDFGGMSWDEMLKGLIGMALALTVVVIAFRSMPKETEILSTSAALLIAGGALILLAQAMKQFGSMSLEEIIKSIAALAGSLVILAYGLQSMVGSVSGSASLLVAAMALMVLAPAMKKLGSMSWSEIGKSLIVLAGAFAVLGVAGLLLGPLVPVILSLSGAMALMGIAVLALGVGLLALSAAFTALSVSGAAGTAALVASLSAIIIGIIDLIPSIAAAIGEAIVVICQVIGDSAGAICEAIKDIVVALVPVLIECVPMLVDGLLVLITELLKSLVEYTPQICESLVQFLIGVFKGLSGSLPELITAGVELLASIFAGIVDGLGIVMESIGSAIGGIIGGIVEGLLNGIAESLPQMGTDLSTFMTNLGPFIEGVRGLDESTLAGMQTMVDMILTLTGAGLLDAIATWISGDSTLSQFAQDLVPFGEAMTAFSSTVAGKIDENAVIAAANAGSIIASMVDTIPKSGGVVGFFTGEHDFSTFSANLVPFGEAITRFSAAVAGKIDETAVLAAANAGKMMAEMASTIPNTGGLVGWFAGDNDMATFGTQLVSFGGAISLFSSTVAGKIDETAVLAAANAGKMMAEMATTIPNTGGLVGWFAGDNDMATFGTQLVTFGTAIKNFSTEVTGIDEGAVTAAANAGKVLSEMAANIPNTGGVWSWFSGDNDMATFGSQLKAFGTAMKNFSSEVSGNIDAKAVTAAANAGATMVRMANSLENTSNVTMLSTLGAHVKKFGANLRGFANEVADVDNTKLSSAIVSTRSLISMAKDAAGVDFEGMNSFATSLGKLGKASVDEFIKSFTDAKDSVLKAGGDMIANLLKGAKDETTTLTKGFKAIASDAVTAIKDKYQSFHDAGKYLVEGLAAGISANSYKAKAKAKAMAEAAVEAARLALKVNSPAKTMIPLGEAIPEGLIVGIENLTGNLKRSAVSMATTAINSTRNAMSQIAEAVNSDVSSQPTIRPILDLSDVESGAGAINGMFNMQPSVGVLSNVGAISAMMNTRQNGDNNDVISAIKELGRTLGGNHGDTYQVNGITYDDGSNVMDAVKTLIRAAKVERRI